MERREQTSLLRVRRRRDWKVERSLRTAGLRAHWLHDHAADCDRRGGASELAAGRALPRPGSGAGAPVQPALRNCFRRWRAVRSPLPESGSADVPAVHGQRHVDVAAGGIGVRAHLMGGCNDPRRLLRVLNLRQGYVEFHGELETTLPGRQQAHPAVDRDIAHLGAFTTADHAQGALEAGRVAHGEELFRVRATALAAHLRRRAELHIQGSVIRAPVAACPAACDRCLRRVKNSRHLGSISGDLQTAWLTTGPVQYLTVITGGPVRRVTALISRYPEARRSRAPDDQDADAPAVRARVLLSPGICPAQPRPAARPGCMPPGRSRAPDRPDRRAAAR